MASEEEQRARKEDAMPDLGLPSKREKMQPVCRIPDIHVHCIVQCASYMVSTYGIASFADTEGVVIYACNKTATNSDLIENLYSVR